MKKTLSLAMISLIVLSTFVILAPQTKATSLPPVGYWRFDESSGTVASDSSGNGNTGTLKNGPQWVNGISGTALSFDGSNDHVSILDSSSLDISGDRISIEFWMKPTVDLPYLRTCMKIFDKGDAYLGEIRLVTETDINYGKIVFCLPFSYPQGEVPSTRSSWASGTWYHLAFTYDGSNMRLYVNGALENSVAKTGNIHSSGFPLSIGSYTLGTSYFFKGILDEFAIYNYTRTAEEIWIDYKSGVGTIFEDDFESYTVGTFPSPPWQMWFSGKGAAEQRIVDTEHVSGSKSLRLWGSNGWGAVAAAPITLTVDTVGYEVMVKAENWGLYPSTKTGALISFAYKIGGSLWTYWARVIFQSDGYIRGYDATPIQSYDLDTWYKVKTIFTISSRAYSVWINDEFKGTFIDTNSYDPSQIEAFAVASDHAEQICYFDDAKVFIPEEFDSTPPVIAVLSPENTTYTTTSIPLNFTVNETTSWIGYSLDNQANVTIATNITLPDLTEGTHNIVVHANDTSGNMASSETIYFTITYRKLLVDAHGELDYLAWERVNVKVAALVSDLETMEPVSEVDISIKIWDPEDILWISTTMAEKLSPGIYVWESNETVREIFWQGGKGVYTVLVEASYGDGPIASDILVFHIDPPDDENIPLPIAIGITLLAIAIIASAILIKKKRSS